LIDVTEYTEKFDATGLSCPMPILRCKKVLMRLNIGDVLYVISTDPDSVRDFEAFCRRSDNELVDSSESGGKFHYFVRKTRH
jgi:tRNA 2-thiouridine synthesizing protein A